MLQKCMCHVLRAVATVIKLIGWQVSEWHCNASIAVNWTCTVF